MRYYVMLCLVIIIITLDYFIMIIVGKTDTHLFENISYR